MSHFWNMNRNFLFRDEHIRPRLSNGLLSTYCCLYRYCYIPKNTKNRKNTCSKSYSNFNYWFHYHWSSYATHHRKHNMLCKFTCGFVPYGRSLNRVRWYPVGITDLKEVVDDGEESFQFASYTMVLQYDLLKSYLPMIVRIDSVVLRWQFFYLLVFIRTLLLLFIGFNVTPCLLYTVVLGTFFCDIVYQHKSPG